MGGRENVGREEGVRERRAVSSSVERGSGGSIGRYFWRTWDIFGRGGGGDVEDVVKRTRKLGIKYGIA